MSSWLLLALLAGSLVFCLLAILAARKYLAVRPSSFSGHLPISILKPLAGLDLGLDLPASTRSGVHLYYGSFRALAKLDPDFDWEEELRETVLHEVRHHRESTAGEDALEDLDGAEDENFKRRDAKAFDPSFYRAGEPVADGAWEVDGDLVVEVEISAREFADTDEVELTVGGEEVVVPLPDRLGDVHFLYLDGHWSDDHDVAVVFVRKRGTWEQLRSLVSTRAPEVLQSSIDFADVRLDEEE